jgi:hypothetical protein
MIYFPLDLVKTLINLKITKCVGGHNKGGRGKGESERVNIIEVSSM